MAMRAWPTSMLLSSSPSPTQPTPTTPPPPTLNHAKRKFWAGTLGNKISYVNFISLDAFEGSTLLRNVYISPTSNLTHEMLEQSFYTLLVGHVSFNEIRKRYDLPLHRHCYFSDLFDDVQHFESFKLYNYPTIRQSGNDP